MAKKKKKRGRQSFANKALNVLGIAIGLSRIIEIVVRNISNPVVIFPKIVQGATFNLSKGDFDLKKGLRFYAPVVGAVGYGYFKSFLMRKFPIR